MAADVVVTVRMPSSLVKALRERMAKDHYSDLSEQMRSVVRRGCLRFSGPGANEPMDLKGRLREELRREGDEARSKALIEGLKALLSEHGGGQK